MNRGSKFELADDIVHPIIGNVIYHKGETLTLNNIRGLENIGIEKIYLVVDINQFMTNGTVKEVKA